MSVLLRCFASRHGLAVHPLRQLHADCGTNDVVLSWKSELSHWYVGVQAGKVGLLQSCEDSPAQKHTHGMCSA